MEKLKSEVKQGTAEASFKTITDTFNSQLKALEKMIETGKNHPNYEHFKRIFEETTEAVKNNDTVSLEKLMKDMSKYYK